MFNIFERTSQSNNKKCDKKIYYKFTIYIIYILLSYLVKFIFMKFVSNSIK